MDATDVCVKVTVLLLNVDVCAVIPVFDGVVANVLYIPPLDKVKPGLFVIVLYRTLKPNTAFLK
jgi:hypothetical protein